MCRRTSVVAALFVLILICMPLNAAAESVVVDFETIPSGAPADGLVISDQFPGATFAIEGGGSPVLAQVGGVITAFFGPPRSAPNDSIAPGHNVGDFFLTDDGLIGLAAKVIVITFNQPVASIGGNVLDVDGSDAWTVEIRDADGQLIDSTTITSGDPGTGDGSATPFLFSRPASDIASIRFPYTGAQATVGFGFDNLTADALVGAVPVPLPPAVWTGLAMLGGIWIAGAVRRRLHRRAQA